MDVDHSSLLSKMSIEGAQEPSLAAGRWWPTCNQIVADVTLDASPPLIDRCTQHS
jgi:hypothetical protein